MAVSIQPWISSTLQNSATTHFRCGEKYYVAVIGNFVTLLAVKEF